jgi:hypothetical protein
MMVPETDSTATGSCLCGAVRFTISGPMRPVVFCHCEYCRRTSGHHVAATACRSDDIVVTGGENLTWYRSSAEAERGFCRHCGGNLFYRPDHRETVSIMAGTLDAPTGLDAAAHIFVDGKSDYYAIGDGLPLHASLDEVDLEGKKP